MPFLVAVCGIEEETFTKSGDTDIIGYLPIVRSWTYDGVTTAPKSTRLKTSDAEEDKDKEGLRLRLGGGKVDDRKQQAIIEFLCQRDEEKLRTRDDDDEEEEHPEWEEAKTSSDGEGGTITFKSYKDDTLRLDWRTRFGCEDAKEEEPDKKKDKDKDDGDDSSKSRGGWGCFSWFFFLLFIGLIVYFAFSAWVNYTRYGAQAGT